MKKLFFILTMLSAATTMSAQVALGGEIGFGSAHTHQTNVSDHNIFVRPEIEFGLSNKFSIGVALGYEHDDQTGEMASNIWSIQPFVRYFFLQVGAFSAFVDGTLDYSTAHTHQYKKNTNAIGAFVRPGISYRLTKHVSLEAHLGDGLYYNHTWNEGFKGEVNADGTVKYLPQERRNTNKYGFKLLSEICFGVSYDL